MLSLRSYVRVVDNSGSFLGQCIGVHGAGPWAKVGDVVTISLQGVHANKKVSKGMVSKAIVIRTIKEARLLVGDFLKFGENAVVLLGPNFLPVSKRVSGPISKELRPRYNKNELRAKYLRILALTAFIV